MFDDLFNNVSQQIGIYLPGILSAIAVLIIGWIVAHILARGVKLAFSKSGLGERLNSLISTGSDVDAIAVISKSVFYLIMLFVLISFFNVLNLPAVSEPLNGFLNEVFQYAPRIFSAAILVVIAFALARLAKNFSGKGLVALNIDTRIANIGTEYQLSAHRADSDSAADSIDLSIDEQSLEVSPEDVKLSSTLPEAVYWVVIALFLPAILGALQIPGLLEPIQDMFTKMFDYLPNLIGAGVILLVGFFVARIVRQVACNLAASLGLNQFAHRFGIGEALSHRKFSDILGVIVYAMILLPVIVAALNTLDIEAITKPAGDVLAKLTSLIPGFLGAGVVTGIAYFVGKIVADIVEDLLSGVGFDLMPAKLGLRLESSESAAPSRLAGRLALVAILLLSAMQALPMMGLEHLAVHLQTFVGFATQVLLGIAIVAAGMYIANFVADLIRESGADNHAKWAVLARVAILIFTGGFALQQMGLSASIVNLAFGSLLGGLALAAAIAFGWGGRDAAKRIVDRMVS